MSLRCDVSYVIADAVGAIFVLFVFACFACFSLDTVIAVIAEACAVLLALQTYCTFPGLFLVRLRLAHSRDPS